MSLKQTVSSTIRPGDDFFGYVNQRWLKSHPIPADKSQMGTFEELADRNAEDLHRLLEAPIASAEPTPIQIVKRYYQGAMDEATIAHTTSTFVTELLNGIAAIADRDSIGRYLADRQVEGQSLLWELIIEPDDKDSQHYMVRLAQAGLGLPERTYYLEDDPTFSDVRKQYLTFLANYFGLLKLDQPTSRAQRVYDFELALATASMTAADCRDPERLYNRFDLVQLQSSYPALDWSTYFKAIGLPTVTVINIAQPDFIAAVNHLITEQSLEHWRDYLTFHALAPLAFKLSKPYEELWFGFYGRVLSGQDQLEPRQRRLVRQCLAVLPEPIGRLFVEHYFDTNAKAEIHDLVKHLQAALAARLERLDWMTEPTKRRAREKLATFLPLLGYPDRWRSYDDLDLGPEYVRNYLAIGRFEWRFQTKRIDDPVDRHEWLMSPALINAYYWPNTNGITFPAAILQPPFFDAGGDFAANYGAIGAVIGHELTHGFDDQGSQYDADGNLKTWWRSADRTAFDAKAKRLVKQYGAYKTAGRAIDGQLTLGENIADLGGLLIAFDALQQKLAESGQHQTIDGFTPEQRFFLAFAYSWCRQSRDQVMLQRLVSDPHSPEVFRVNGVVTNIDAFYQAFGLKVGDRLYRAPGQRVRIW